MKAVNTIAKVLVALAAVAGAVYVVATYGDKIVAWAKGLLGCCKCGDECGCDCQGECTCGCDCDCAEVVEAPAEEAPAAEEAAEEAPVEEAAEEGSVVADEADFEG